MQFNKTRCLVFMIACFFLIPVNHVWAAEYYVSTNGNDTNSGSLSAPFKTFTKGVSVLNGGDTLFLTTGTYNQKLTVNKNGTAALPISIKPVSGHTVIIDGQNQLGNLIDLPGSYLNIQGLEVINSNDYGVNLTGQYITVDSLKVHNILNHGIYTNGQHITIARSEVYRTNLMNQAKTLGSGWGSGIKVKVGGDDILITGNKSYNNYGEGIAVTRGINVTVKDNTVYDNYSENIYIDNSHDVLVENNFSYCTANSEYYRNGAPANAYSMGEESYTGWGAQLARVTFRNNLGGFCKRSIVYYGANVTGGGLDTISIIHNTFWGSLGVSNALSIAAEPAKTRNTLIANNIFHSQGAKAWIEDPTGITLKNNYWVNGAPPSSSNANGSGDLSGDVKLATAPTSTDPQTYKLSATSPAIDHGAALNLSSDFYGNSRPNGNGYDMGAHEYGGSTPTPTPKPGDIDNDLDVDFSDARNLLLHFSTNWSLGDFNRNGLVDIFDYKLILSYFGQ